MLCDQIPNSSNMLVNDVSFMSLEDEHDKPYKIPKLDWNGIESISFLYSVAVSQPSAEALNIDENDWFTNKEF